MQLTPTVPVIISDPRSPLHLSNSHKCSPPGYRVSDLSALCLVVVSHFSHLAILCCSHSSWPVPLSNGVQKQSCGPYECVASPPCKRPAIGYYYSALISPDSKDRLQLFSEH